MRRKDPGLGAWRMGTVLLLGGIVVGCRDTPRQQEPAPAPTATVRPLGTTRGTPTGDEASVEFPMPKGQHVLSRCESARAIVAHAERLLAFEPRPPKDADFGRELTDWLDPYGHWSAATDAPMAKAIRKNAGKVLSELLLPAGPCDASETLGAALRNELTQLEAEFDAARHAPGDERSTAREAATAPLPESRSVKELARELGSRFARLQRLQDPRIDEALGTARGRLFPHYDSLDEWAGLVRTAAVRAYVRLIDAHGGWAPKDEALSIYDLDLLDAGPLVLWQHADSSVLGAIARDGALPPLRSGDVVLKVGDLWLAGLPPEQIDEVSIGAFSTRNEVSALVYREGSLTELTLTEPREVDAGDYPSALESELLDYGSRHVALVRIHDVYDYLGSDLGRTVRELGEDTSVAALILDLRDNGGGAMDGALDALAHFLPKRPMFPMKSRLRNTEVDVTPPVSDAELWKGPLAVLVDGGTASAAEMLAGALSAYGRATVVGGRTFGKGCIQEYIDDDTKLGIFRITTSLYSLPNGAPVQRVGILPDLPLTLGKAAFKEREALLGAVGPSWRGPDVRSGPSIPPTPWPKADGVIGPCADAGICKALAALSRDSLRVAKQRSSEARR